MEWISIKDELPKYGEVVILKWHGKVQDVFYKRDYDDGGDFFMDALDDYDGIPMQEAFEGDAMWMRRPK